jgi:REP element-mobilizing transposase RayT
MWSAEYHADEIKFAYNYLVYLRWQTHRRRPSDCLATLDAATMNELVVQHAIRVLELECTRGEALLLVSLQPTDSLAAAEGKLKGQAAKWLRQQSGERFARSYFASTSGKSTAEQIDAYLESQGEHHGYARRVLPPVFVKTFPVAADDHRVQPAHALACLRFHFVFATWFRRGVFGAEAGAAIANAWQMLENEHRFELLKVSFVPDHVHLTVRVHLSVAPAPLVAVLMNAGQAVIWRQFAADAIQARVERLWQPSAYVGSYGDRATPQIAAYLRRWRESV